eukprot:2322786-Prymnesium_polylepis.3
MRHRHVPRVSGHAWRKSHGNAHPRSECNPYDLHSASNDTVALLDSAHSTRLWDHTAHATSTQHCFTTDCTVTRRGPAV